MHEVGKRARAARPDDIPTDLHEYEKERGEYTFSPNKYRKQPGIAPDRREGYLEPLQRDVGAPGEARRHGESPESHRYPENAGLGPDEHFMINVNLGSQTKVILATLRSDPVTLSKKFL